VSKPLIPQTDARLVGSILKRLAALERAVASRRSQRAIYYATPAGVTTLGASSWSDLCSVSVTVQSACRVRITGQVYFVSTAAGGPGLGAGIFFGPAGLYTNAIVQAPAIDLQGSTVATQPIEHAGAWLDWTMNLTPGTYTFSLAAFKDAAGAAQVNPTRTAGIIGPDPATWIQVVVE
jgi:hypothetical protein